MMNNSIKRMLLAILLAIVRLGLMFVTGVKTSPWLWIFVLAFGYYGYYTKD